MWLLMSFLPDWLSNYGVHIIFASGVIGTFGGKILSKIPFISTYGNIIKGVSIVFLILGIYLEGGLGNENSWRKKVADLQAKIAIAEQQSKDANVKLDQALKEKTKVVKEKQIVIQERIKEVEKRIDAECKVDSEAVKILNDAAKK
jgi:hypothetical protein